MNSLKKMLYSSAALVSMVAASSAMAAPQGGTVVGGNASISTVGKKTDIHQSTNKAIIDWRSFDIGADEHTEFHQPSASSMTLNRINDVKASQIDGRLTANGHIMLINPNGVVFGGGAQVDVGSLTASTADIDNDDFMAGNLNFQHKGAIDGKIINHGLITAKEAGLVSLVAPQVENHGIIRAKLGKIRLAAADTFVLDLAGDGLMQVEISSEEAQKLARNTGTIDAEGGMVHMTAARARSIVDSLVEHSGVINAQSLTHKGGKVILGADQGTVRVSGVIEASGKTGGGEILIGGDYQGKGEVKTARLTDVAQTARINANATDSGDGGKVIVWADEDTTFAGKVSAHGGANSGDGGFVETSGKIHLKVDSAARIDVSAPNGTGGEWLLDPTDITITDGGGDVDTATINATLNGGGNVTITTAGAGGDTGIITMTNATIDKSVANNDVTLTLLANENIVVTNTTLTSTSGDALNVVLNADLDANQSGYISITSSSFTTSGGNFTAGGGVNPLTTAAWGNATVDSGVRLNNTVVNTGAGNISLRGHGYDNAASSGHIGTQILNASALQTTSGTITLDGTGGIGISNNYGVRIHDVSVMVTSATGDISITGQGGSTGAAGSSSNFGVYIHAGADITSTGIGAGAATITLNGTGGAGDDNNYGVYLNNAGTLITSIDGAISVTGQGGSNGAVGSDANYGMLIAGAAAVTSTGVGANAATITLDGTGGAGEDANFGVYVANAGTTITSVDGAISLTGQGGSNGAAGSINNYGVTVANNVDILSTGIGANAATITLDGTGGAGEDSNFGVYVESASTLITSVDGDISITGVGGSNGAVDSDANYGVYILNAADIISTGIGANAATITIDGTGGDGDDTNYGVYLNSPGTLITSDEGAISITGQGGSNGLAGSDTNYGVYVINADITSTGTGADAATITVNGTGGAGDTGNRGLSIAAVGTLITSIDGAISLIGQGGSNGASNNPFSYGIDINDSSVTSTGTGANAATITLNATAGAGDLSNRGLSLGGANMLITSVDGAISLIGRGGNGGVGSNNNYGVYVASGADITSTGIGTDAATITLDGTGGIAEDGNYGVWVRDAGTLITSVDGAITLTGQGGSNGAAGSNGNIGVYVSSDADITSTGTGANAATIILDGTGGAGEDTNYGVYIRDPGTLITAADGAISIIGQGGSNGAAGSNNNNGVYVSSDADISSTGTGANAATITLNGTGGAGEDSNWGVFIAVSGTLITSVDGAISLIGQGGSNGAVGSDANYGIRISSDADITSTGTGADAATITLDGTGGAGESSNFGVYLQTAGTLISAVDGDISITGLGGNGLVSGTSNHGIRTDPGADITSTGTSANAATITLTGTGNGLGTASKGIRFLGLAQSVDGDITLTGNGNTNGTFNEEGIRLEGTVTSTGTGADAANITITGTGGGQTNATSANYGVIASTSAIIESTDGDIFIVGIGGGNGANLSNNYGFLSDGTLTTIETRGDANITIDAQGSSNTTNDINIGSVTNRIGEGVKAGIASGDITLITDGLSMNNATTLETTGSIIIKPRTVSTSIGIGGGAGTLNISDAELAFLVAGGSVIIGDAAAGTGVVTIDSTNVVAGGYDLLVHGGAMTVNGNIDGGGKVWLVGRGAGNDLTLNANVTAMGAGDSLVAATDGNFINNVGAGVLDPDTGRWLVYSAHPNTITKGGLAGPRYYNRSFNTAAPGTIPGAVDSFVYAFQPVLTFTADDLTLATFDPLFNSFTSTFSGLFGADTQGQAFSGTPGFVKTQTAPGQYNIGMQTGSLSSIMGYGFSFVAGMLDMPTPTQELGSSVLNQIHQPDLLTSNTQTITYTISDGQTDETVTTTIPFKREIKADHSSQDSGIRLVTSDFVEIEEPLANFFQLCSYDSRYCQGYN